MVDGGGALPLVVPHRTSGLQIPEQVQRLGVHHTPDRREGRLESRGDPPVPLHRHHKRAPASFVGPAQADTGLRRRGLERQPLIEVLVDQALVQANWRVHQPDAE